MTLLQLEQALQRIRARGATDDLLIGVCADTSDVERLVGVWYKPDTSDPRQIVLHDAPKMENDA